MTEPDLFVVCKNCSAEVSPYVTECPYCGQRVRKRAPKIERDGASGETRKRARPSRLPRLRREEIPGIAPETRPYVTGVLVALCLAAAVAIKVAAVDFGMAGPFDGEWWRVAVAPFVHLNLGYLFIAMLAVAIFGAHLERRFGRAVPLLIFLLAGAGGAALSTVLGFPPELLNPLPLPAAGAALGANGAALGLLVAWFVDDRRAARRGDDRETDLIGVYVIAAVVALVALAEPSASLVAAAGGAVVGALAGAALGLGRR